MLVDWLAQPVDPRVIADGSMGRINQDYLIVFVGRVLQLRVQGTENLKPYLHILEKKALTSLLQLLIYIEFIEVLIEGILD